jgi:ribosome maturation factor RimP
VRETHFQRAIGRRVRVQTRTPIADRRVFRGVLASVGPDGVTVQVTGGADAVIPFAAIEKANIEYDFNRPAGPRHAHA